MKYLIQKGSEMDWCYACAGFPPPDGDWFLAELCRSFINQRYVVIRFEDGDLVDAQGDIYQESDLIRWCEIKE